MNFSEILSELHILVNTIEHRLTVYEREKFYDIHSELSIIQTKLFSIGMRLRSLVNEKNDKKKEKQSG